jgi:hypothetical protein
MNLRVSGTRTRTKAMSVMAADAAGFDCNINAGRLSRGEPSATRYRVPVDVPTE